MTGWMKRGLHALLAADLNLFAYHLPLDAHAELGNNAQFGRRLGLLADAFFACGHPATERYGVQALGEQLALRFGLHHRFIDMTTRHERAGHDESAGSTPCRTPRRVALGCSR